MLDSPPNGVFPSRDTPYRAIACEGIPLHIDLMKKNLILFLLLAPLAFEVAAAQSFFPASAAQAFGQEDDITVLTVARMEAAA